MYQMHRVFCATSWDLEEERREFYSVIGDFNEAQAMQHGWLYVPVSLINVRDKRPFQNAVDENIRDSRHYILALSGDWGPPERDFQRDYELALHCSADPSLPMREVAVMLRKPLQGRTQAAGLPEPTSVFSTTEEFKERLLTLLSQWLAAGLAAGMAGSSSLRAAANKWPDK